MIYARKSRNETIRFANRFFSIDERGEMILEGLKRHPIDVKQRLRKVPSLGVAVAAHIPTSLRKSLTFNSLLR